MAYHPKYFRLSQSLVITVQEPGPWHFFHSTIATVSHSTMAQWHAGALARRLHVLTRSLHYASAVFEGEYCYDRNIFRLRDHTDRLFASTRVLGFDISYTGGEIDAACAATLRANNLTDAYLHPLAWAGSEVLAVSAQ